MEGSTNNLSVINYYNTTKKKILSLLGQMLNFARNKWKHENRDNVVCRTLFKQSNVPRYIM